jgi:hypothetical protein
MSLLVAYQYNQEKLEDYRDIWAIALILTKLIVPFFVISDKARV